MLLRRLALTFAALAAACAPSVSPDAGGNPKTVDFAVFNPATGSIPLPNDLALQPSAIATQNPTQQAVLNAFLANGGFPSDQEVPVTIDLVRDNIDSKGTITRAAPPFDATSLTASTLVVVRIPPAAAPAPAPIDPAATQYTTSTDHGTLTLHSAVNTTTKSRAWLPGRYIVALRGGANGAKSTDGVTLSPDAAMYLLTQDKVLTDPSLLTLIPGDTLAAKQATAAQLEQLRQSYLPAFAVVDSVFPHQEIASITVFTVGTPGGTELVTDPSAGVMPLPSDFLLDASGHPSAQFAANFGALAPGFQSLDGFSTTAMILSTTSAPVVAPTINNKSVLLYELNLTATPPTATRLLDAAEALPGGKVPAYITEPPQITVTPPGSPVAVSTAIGLQPAHVIPGGFPSTPLKEGTEYVVLVTDRVKDTNGKSLVPSTLNQIVLLDPSLPAAVGGKSQIAGVPDDQAAGLDQIRQAVNLAIGTALADPVVNAPSQLQRSNFVAAYSFRTQTFKTAAVGLAALPYGSGNATLTPPPSAPTSVYCTTATNPACSASATGTINAEYSKYGIGAAPQTNVGWVVETFMTTLNGLDPASGAFLPGLGTTAQPSPEVIPVMIALPTAANAGCTGSPPCTIPLAVFRHGLGGSRAQMLLIADKLTKNGIAVAAIDAAKHGARAWCNPSRDATTSDCTTSCVADPALAKQGDPAGAQPGHCANANPFDSKLALAGTTTRASSNYLVSLNFFRTRDTLRQDIIDESQLIRVLAPNPAGVAPNGFTTASFGYQIDPNQIFYVGQSLGAIQGVVDVAANPRVKRANFNVGGGTIVDVFSTSPSLSPTLNALLAANGIPTGSPAYLKTLQVGKWVLDPADPVNYAVNLLQSPLASPIIGGAAPAGRDFLGQMAKGDNTVPNEETVELFKLIPLKDDTSGGTTTFQVATSASAPGNVVGHGFLLDWANYPAQASAAQSDTASFFLTGTHPSATSLNGP